MASLYESRGFGTAREFTDAAANASLINDLDPDAKDLEGYLFPETYAVPRRTPASRLIEQMVQQFRAAYDDNIRSHAEERQLTTREVVALASLIEKETGARDERPLVAAVYTNRLKIGMGLQADPTVVYALQKAGKYDGNIRREDLALDPPTTRTNTAAFPQGPSRPRQSVARSGCLASRRALSLLRQPQRRHPRLCHDPRRAQRQRAEVSGSLFSQSGRGTGARGTRQGGRWRGKGGPGE
jgi:UPF0755 protein